MPLPFFPRPGRLLQPLDAIASVSRSLTSIGFNMGADVMQKANLPQREKIDRRAIDTIRYTFAPRFERRKFRTNKQLRQDRPTHIGGRTDESPTTA